MVWIPSVGHHRSLVTILALAAAVNASSNGEAVLRKLQTSTRTDYLDDGNVITVTFNGDLCTASIRSKSAVFGGRSCTCFRVGADCTDPTDAIYDCSPSSNDPCAKKDCKERCLNVNSQGSPTTGSQPVAAPVVAPVAAPSTDSPVAVQTTDVPVESTIEIPATNAPSTTAPTQSPVKESITTEEPTQSPTEAPATDVPTTDVPMTDIPTTLVPVLTLSPTESPVADPSILFTEFPSTSTLIETDTSDAAPTMLPSASDSPVSSLTPSFSDAPAVGDNLLSTMCDANNRCNALGLIGACCPTTDGWMLECCNDAGPVEETCELNLQCKELGLKGACCPVEDEQWGYLDCCSPVPSECIGEGCVITSATQYTLMVNGQVGTSGGLTMSVSVLSAGIVLVAALLM